MSRIILRHIFDFCMEHIFSRSQQIRLGLHIANRALGQGIDAPALNGEYWLMEHIKEMLRGKTAVVFDVGANIGEWTRRFVQGMLPGLTVYSFEPSKATFEFLKTALSGEVTEILLKPVNLALSDSNSSGQLYLGGELAGTNSLHFRRGVHHKETETVLFQRGDAFCLENGIQQIELLKIDTEGHELSVLLGFDSMLSRGAIDFIQFEYGGTWIDSHILLMDVFDLLLGKGYVLSKIHPKGLDLFFDYAPALENFVYANYLAIRKDLLASLKWIQ